MILPENFYNRKTQIVAQDLLGCFLVRKSGDKIMRVKIVETEAYDGPRDLASHASRGRTARNAVMFGRPGIFYVYFTYGMHYMLNVVTRPVDYPAAVLIRAVEPCQMSNVKRQMSKTNGPARLTRALSIDKTFNALPAYTKKHGLWLEPRIKKIAAGLIVRKKRIGVDYAGTYKDKLWRFYLKNNPFVSRE